MIEASRFADAVGYAAKEHGDHYRKRAAGDQRPMIPYLSHLLGVASIVIEDGGDTDDAVAALLHDIIEDRPTPDRARDIDDRFGPRVLSLVNACTGNTSKQEPDFRTRKQHYLDRLGSERDTGAVRVSLADKVHNARSTVNDLEADGPAVWERFNAPYLDQIWWYTGLSDAYAQHAAAGRVSQARADELRRLVDRMAEFS